MARYEHLPIYKKAMDMTIYFEKIVRSFSRYNKYTLGTELREKSRKVVELIIKANSTTAKRPLLLELRERLEGLKILIRLCKEVKAFNRFNSFVYASDLVIDISRQNEGWMRKLKIGN
ncbi:MAG: four helix bundle protein [Candidatus Brocadiaceae bacterium]|nr:four helix bundle protein [Candidatus Brocadiaceae bacterium]